MSGITNPSEKYFKDGLWTYDGSVWRPQNQLIAYRATYQEFLSNTSAVAGLNNLDGTAVPTGQVWIVNSVLAFNTITAACVASIRKRASAVDYILKSQLYATITRYADYQGQVVMAAGEFIRATFESCVLNDDIYAHIVGYKFYIAE